MQNKVFLLLQEVPSHLYPTLKWTHVSALWGVYRPQQLDQDPLFSCQNARVIQHIWFHSCAHDETGKYSWGKCQGVFSLAFWYSCYSASQLHTHTHAFPHFLLPSLSLHCLRSLSLRAAAAAAVVIVEHEWVWVLDRSWSCRKSRNSQRGVWISPLCWHVNVLCLYTHAQILAVHCFTHKFKKSHSFALSWAANHTWSCPGDLIRLDLLFKYWQELMWPCWGETRTQTRHFAAKAAGLPAASSSQRAHTHIHECKHTHARSGRQQLRLCEAARAEVGNGAEEEEGEQTREKKKGWASSWTTTWCRSAGESETYPCWSCWRWVSVHTFTPPTLHPSIPSSPLVRRGGIWGRRQAVWSWK